MREESSPLGPSAHVAVFCAALGGFVNLYSTQAIYPDLSARFGLTVTSASALLTTTTFGLAMTAPFAGRVAHRFGSRRAILAGLTALVCSVFLFAFATSRAQLVILRLAQGMLIPVVLSALLASIGSWSKGKGFAATYVTGTVLGGVIGRFLPALVLAHSSWHGAFFCFGAVQVLLLTIVGFTYPKQSRPREAALGAGEWLSSLVPLLRERLFGVAVSGFCLLFTQAALTTYVAIRLAASPYNWSTGALGWIYTVFLPALIFVRLTPRALAYFGPARTLRYAIAAGWVGVGFTLASSAVLILAGLVIFCAAAFVSQTTLAHQLGLASDENKEMAAGIYLCCYYLGGGAGALAPALVWASLGWIGCVLVVATAQLGGFLLVRRQHQLRSAAVTP